MRLQSFSAAASALNLTQPTVSKTIQALEEELGAPLLVKENGRKKRQVATTPIGEEVYRHALNLLHERDLLLAPVHEDFDSITLCEYPLVVLMPRAQARRRSQPQKPATRTIYPVRLRVFPQRNHPNRLPQQGFTPNVVCRTGQWDLLAAWWRTISASPFCPNTTPAKSTPTLSPPSR
ncbi:LysR family transcriptional regulator [Neisseria sicca]|uniref:LysR family transcriptional regulator n=1 Tax=Neisseria sicca TaxID=490 RepID=UPI000319F5EE|nr:LysR family transcriptional regulator [Neisseria sicca]